MTAEPSSPSPRRQRLSPAGSPRESVIGILRPSLIGLTGLLAACTNLSDETKGRVYRVTGDTVTIIGPFSMNSMDAFYTPYVNAKPTPAMVAQAREVCPGATFDSASPSTVDFDYLLYLFRC